MFVARKYNDKGEVEDERILPLLIERKNVNDAVRLASDIPAFFLTYLIVVRNLGHGRAARAFD